MTTQSAASAETDAFLLDSEQLHAIAEESAIREGLAWFRADRVVGVERGDSHLWAQVEDPESREMLSVEVRDQPGGLAASCGCGDIEHRLCAHAAATLYAYAAEVEGADELLGAVDGAIGERAQRGRAEVRVEPLGGEPWFGTWSARSVTPTSHYARSYRVNIRSLKRRANHCSCPDFATNQLGTCKHIEAVLHRIAKRRDYRRIKDQPAPHPYVYLAWDAVEAPRIALHRGAEISSDVQALLDEYFDAAGLFKGRLPEDFFRFAERVQDRADLDLGEDAVGHARRLAAEIARHARAAEIGARIRASGGHLPGVRARLYPYQMEGAAFLAGNGRALLADDMGLGKTLQAITAATWLSDNAEVERILVVCPASLKQQWAREIEKFTGRSAQVVQGGAEARGVQYRRGGGFFIVNYELVLRDLTIINETLRPDLLILDEAQRIKNWRTKIATAIKLIPSRHAFVLSGTPLENRLEDLYSLMQVVDPHVLGPLWRYMVDFHITDERDKVLGYRNLSELRRRLAPVMLRRDRRLVSDQLPERIEQRLDIELTPKQWELHDSAMNAAGQLANIAKRRPLTPAESNKLMASLQQARMACDSAGLVDKESEGSPKLDELVTILDELCVQSGLKAVVFSQWEQMTQMAEHRLKALGLGCVRLHGGVPTAKRGELMDRFREDDAVQVFLSTDAGGVGLNLQTASVLVNLDVPWNPAVLDQRIGRVHRLGQTEKVQVIGMVAADAYEERVLGLVQGKRHLFNNVVDPEAGEDVVGVSKKLLESLVEDLAESPESPAAGAAQGEAAEAAVPAESSETATARTADGGEPIEHAIRDCIEEIQAAFGPRVERILGSGGGLLVVLDRVDELADRAVDSFASEVPVAVIDPRTLTGLRRLGAGSPLAETRSYYDVADAAAGPTGSRMLVMAGEKLKAAEVLVEQQCTSAAIELLNSALLSACAARAGLEQAPQPRDAAVWLYGEALPKGWLNAEEVGLVLRGVTLAQAPSVPEPLLAVLLDDARSFVGSVF